MNEEQVVQTVMPVIKALADLEKKLEALQLIPGPKGDDGRDGADADAKAIAEAIKSDVAFIEAVKGARGADGAEGQPGRDGTDADPETVAKSLAANAEFVSAVTGNYEQEPWQPGIYREGKCVSHFTGRSYQAVRDTVEEPGDSEDWKRLGTHGLRDTGGFSETRQYEPGDFYHKDGATFFFDGVSHRLFAAKSVTPNELEKAVKPIRASVLEASEKAMEREAALDARIGALTAAIEAQKSAIEQLANEIDHLVGRA